jgi:erythromycin esterase
MSWARVALLVLLCATASISCGGDPVDPGTESPESLTEEPPDPQRLLTDEELRTASSPVPTPAAWTDWIIANHDPIRSLTSDSFADLQFLKLVVGDRRLVQLGESGHGVSEYDHLKVRLIKFLHQEVGFDVIAFESSIYECYRANQTADQHSAMNWHAEEVVPLFAYIKSTRETARPLTLAGFDTQISSFSGVQERSWFLRTVVEKLDEPYAAEVYTTDSTFLAESGAGRLTTFLQTHGVAYQARYRELVHFLDTNEGALVAAFPATPAVPLIARQTAWSMIQYIAQLQAESGTVERTESRDFGMAENLTVLLDRIYPDKKVVTWAHNFHIRHASEEVITGYGSPQSMGTWLYERFEDDLYTVGFYMGRGRAAWNSRQVYTVGPMQPNGLESVLFQPRIKHLFVDLLHRDRVPENSWMFQQITVMRWGKYAEELVPRDQYSGIVFIDTVNPPDYVN